jgi:hypothetical protein
MRVIFFCLFFLSFLSTSVEALTIDKFELTTLEYTDKEIDTSYQQSVVESVYNEIKDSLLKDLKLEIIYSQKGIKGIHGCAFENGGVQYIVMARADRDYFKIAGTFLHELGHALQRHHNIDLKIFSYITRHEYKASGRWQALSKEIFAEQFKIWALREHFKHIYELGFYNYQVDGVYDLDLFNAIYFIFTL